jgi:hypothetical protein
MEIIFANANSTTNMMDSESHGAYLKILHNNIKKYNTIKRIPDYSRHCHETFHSIETWHPGFAQACVTALQTEKPYLPS